MPLDTSPPDSPFKDKFRRGRYHFGVVAMDPPGNANPSPAMADFKLERKQRR